ncbi:MAG: GMC family oxidoreductase [Acidobacteria bacterium]|nr:GMC family oxidoreductase [Acidobacteriota bacterium]
MQVLTRTEPYDAVIVGSGATGGWVAKQLTEAGWNVAVLEAGSNVDPSQYSEHVQAYQTKYHFLDKSWMRNRPMQRLNYACEETNFKWYANDVENPYTYEDGKEFRWIRVRALGGRSLAWGRGSFRHSDLDFKAASRDGHGIDWPISYAEMKPHYETVERFIGVSGTAENLPQIPDSIFQPPLPMYCGERRLKEAVWKKFRRVITDGRSAVLTKPLNGRAACHHCGPCHRGCITESYFSSPTTTLRAAEATGKVTIQTDAMVSHVTVDPKTGRATGVAWYERFTREPRETRAKVVVLAGSTLESTRLLLNSAPGGLANSSGVLGHYLMDHLMGGVGGTIPMEKNEPRWAGPPQSPNHIMVPRFRNVDRVETNGFIRGYHINGACRPTFNMSAPGFGADYKRRVRDDAHWSMRLGAFIEQLPQYENRVEINKTQVDAWGIPTLHVHCAWGENELKMWEDSQTQIEEMLASAGVKNIQRGGRDHSAPGFAIHEVGTARMGADPKTSVLDKHCRAWDVRNLFVADGASWPTVACQNPTLTMMANAVRISAYMTEAAKKGEI